MVWPHAAHGLGTSLGKGFAVNCGILLCACAKVKNCGTRPDTPSEWMKHKGTKKSVPTADGTNNKTTDAPSIESILEHWDQTSSSSQKTVLVKDSRYSVVFAPCHHGSFWPRSLPAPPHACQSLYRYLVNHFFSAAVSSGPLRAGGPKGALEELVHGDWRTRRRPCSDLRLHVQPAAREDGGCAQGARRIEKYPFRNDLNGSTRGLSLLSKCVSAA